MSLDGHGRSADVWGILGGMGPLASAEFLSTVYEESAGEKEQLLPRVILYSDPTIPDRTDALLNGRESALAIEVAWRARRLLDAGATKLAFCCVTLHRVVSLLPDEIQRKLTSLVDLAIDAVESGAQSHLLLCTEGTRTTEVFERHERWDRVRRKIVMLDSRDQQAIHALIYEVKKNDRLDQHLERVVDLARRYGVDSCIAGCTELHILAKRFKRRPQPGGKLQWIDPLTSLAVAICGRTLMLHRE